MPPDDLDSGGISPPTVGVEPQRLKSIPGSASRGTGGVGAKDARQSPSSDRSSSLQAVILVGGEGTRLRPLTYGTPKPMVPLIGVPFLERTLGRLREAGVDDVILAAGYLPKAIQEHFGDGSRVSMRVTYVVETEPLGTAGALRNVADHLAGPFFVLNGDVLTSLDLRAMLAFHAKRGGLGVLHAIRVDDPSAFGCVVRDADDRILRFVEKPPRADAPTQEVNAGTYLLEREILDRIPVGRAVSIERETFPELLAAGERLYSFVTDDYWLDLGQPHHYLQAHSDVLDGKLPLARSADPDATRGALWRLGDRGVPPNVRPPSFVGEDVEIDDTATIGPHAVIGNFCKVGPHALVRDSVLWEHVVLDAGARVTGAILATRVHIGREAVVTPGAVIGHDATVADGTVLEPDARVAARTSPIPTTQP
jgi:mannose-1-phosphate guanylyltransferase